MLLGRQWLSEVKTTGRADPSEAGCEQDVTGILYDRPDLQVDYLQMPQSNRRQMPSTDPVSLFCGSGRLSSRRGMYGPTVAPGNHSLSDAPK